MPCSHPAAPGAGEPSLAALTFAAQVALAAGEPARARELLDRAVAASAASDSDARWDVMNHVRHSGRLADALALLEAGLRDATDDCYGEELYGLAISEAHQRVNGQQPADGCSCGSGSAWEECCGPRERAALSRFADRSGLTELSDAVGAFVAGSEHERAVEDQVTKQLEAYDDLDWEPADLAEFRVLLAEQALLMAEPGRADAEPEDDTAAGSLAAFAADPATPAELAAKAEVWRTRIHYGLWQVGPAAPGLWCTDICTGIVRYADFPAHFTDGWPSWSVWLGGIVPVDGIWRATGTGMRLSPDEADAAAELIESAVISIVHSLAGKKRPSIRHPSEPMRIGGAEPMGVYVGQQDPLGPDLASLTGMILGQLLSRVVGELHLYRDRVRPGDFAAPGDGWEKYWLDQPLPALLGLTPRQAAEGKERLRVEALLRQFEYEADLLAARGQSGIDAAWLRQELDLEADAPDEA